MDVKYAPSTENESGRELINVYVLSDGKRIKSTFVLNDDFNGEVELILAFEEQLYRSKASTYFNAMNKIRENLEMDDKYLICYGTSEDIYPSGISVSMGTGRLAYRCKPGRPALRNDIVDIFNFDEHCVPATIQAQKWFNRKWLKSLSGKTAKKKIRIGQKLAVACLTTGAALWGCVGLYRWLTNDNGSETVWIVLAILGVVFFAAPFLPFFEIIHKPGKKITKQKNCISVEEQLNELSGLGIKPKQEDFIKWVNDEQSAEEIESDPYNSLLYTLSGKRRYDHGRYRWESLSDDIFAFYTQCVVSDNIYEAAFKRLAVLSKGVFNVSDVSGEVNRNDNYTIVEFTFNGKDYSWQLRYDDEWFDVLFISKVNGLLLNTGSEKLFYMSNINQGLYIVFNTDEVISKLNRLVTTPFFLDYTENDDLHEFSYSLRTNNSIYSSNMLCSGLFESILNITDPDPDGFMVLAPDEPIDRCTFLQMTYNTAKNADSNYILETGFGRKNKSTALFRLYTNDKEIALRYFNDYWRDQIVPDVSSWEDVSGELMKMM